MKQKKGKDYKMTRQWGNDNREAKGRLKKNIKAGITRGEFNEEKLDTPVQIEGDKINEK